MTVFDLHLRSGVVRTYKVDYCTINNGRLKGFNFENRLVFSVRPEDLGHIEVRAEAEQTNAET